MAKPLIFVSTCEFSGDMHGEVLIREIAKLLPTAEFYGIGGTRMASAGMRLMYDPTKSSTIGFVEAVKNLKKMRRLIKEVFTAWERRRPDLMLWLDSGGLNLVLAKEAKKRGIPVVCMFSPSAWAYGRDRAVKLAERVQLLLAVLPFEADFYRKFGANAVHVGHPLVDRVHPDQTPEDYRRSLGITSDRKLLALLPGSRRQEVTQLLPVMLEAVTQLVSKYDLQPVIPVADSIDRALLDAILAQYPVTPIITSGGVYNLMAAADMAVIASGTATLEAALLNTPMVIVYHISTLSFWIGKMMQTPEHKQNPCSGLPNLIAGRRIVPELSPLSGQLFTPENLIRTLRGYLDHPERLLEVKRDLLQVKEQVGPAGVMPRAAGMIAQLLKREGIK